MLKYLNTWRLMLLYEFGDIPIIIIEELYILSGSE